MKLKENLGMIRKVRIAGQDIKVKVVDKISKKENYVGMCKNNELEILLSRRSKWGDKINRQNMQEHLLHEIIHRVSRTNDVNLSEAQVRRLGHGLYQVLSDNNIPVGK